MYREDKKQWIKHLDFIFLDVLVLQIAYCLAFYFRHGSWNVYGQELYLTMGVSLTLCDLLVIFLVEAYHGVLRRDAVSELINPVELFFHGSSLYRVKLCRPIRVESIPSPPP